MVVEVMPRRHGRAIERGGLVVPAAQRGLDLFVDSVPDRLHNLGFDDAALGVDGHLDDDVAHQVPRKLGAVEGEIRKHHWIRDVNFVAGDRPVNHGAQRRPGVGIVLACFRIGHDLLGLWGSFWRLGLRAWTLPARSAREQ